MAIYHFTAKIVSRSRGQSAVATAAYNSRDVLENEKTGQRHDYRHHSKVIFSGIFTPKNAPDWAHDRQTLWSAVEQKENRKDAQLARNIDIALPYELTDQQREYIIKDFVRENFVRQGMVADVSIHAPDPEGDMRNHHAHILLTMRSIGPDGFGQKVREWNSRAQLEGWREKWEHLANRHLERYGHEARIDRRTLEAQGIDRDPTQHLGPIASEFERAGIFTDRGDINRAIVEQNQQREQLKAELETVTLAIEEQTRQLREEYLAKTAEAIRGAWTATQDGLDFIIALHERGLHLAQDDKNNLAAVAENGFVHRLDTKTYGTAARDMREAVHLVQRDHSSLIIPTIDETRGELKQQRDEARRQREQARELKTQRRAARLGATLYDRADMASMQHDAMRHLKDAHRQQEQKSSEPGPLHPDDHRRFQEATEAEQRQREEQESARKTREKEPERDQATLLREHKMATTEQTASQQTMTARQQRAAKRLERAQSRTRDDDGGRELERER